MMQRPAIELEYRFYRDSNLVDTVQRWLPIYCAAFEGWCARAREKSFWKRCEWILIKGEHWQTEFQESFVEINSLLSLLARNLGEGLVDCENTLLLLDRGKKEFEEGNGFCACTEIDAVTALFPARSRIIYGLNRQLLHHLRILEWIVKRKFTRQPLLTRSVDLR